MKIETQEKLIEALKNCLTVAVEAKKEAVTQIENCEHDLLQYENLTPPVKHKLKKEILRLEDLLDDAEKEHGVLCDLVGGLFEIKRKSVSSLKVEML